MDWELLKPLRTLVFPVVVIISLVWCWPARSHDHDHPEWDDFLRSLTNQRNGSCCDGSEAFSVSNPDWDTTTNEDYPYKVFLKGSKGSVWVMVPRFAVVKQNNKIGVAKVWPVLADDEGNAYEIPLIRCFMPGSFS